MMDGGASEAGNCFVAMLLAMTGGRDDRWGGRSSHDKTALTTKKRRDLLRSAAMTGLFTQGGSAAPGRRSTRDASNIAMPGKLQ